MKIKEILGYAAAIIGLVLLVCVLVGNGWNMLTSITTPEIPEVACQKESYASVAAIMADAQSEDSKQKSIDYMKCMAENTPQ